MPNELLWKSTKRTTSLRWPTRVDGYLDELCELATAAGENISRTQLLAALVIGAPHDGDAIGVLVRNYRRLSIEAGGNSGGPLVRLGRPRVEG